MVCSPLLPPSFPLPHRGRGQGEGRSRPLGEMIRKSRMTVLSRVVPRRLSLIVAHGLIGAMLEQEVDHLGLAVQSFSLASFFRYSRLGRSGRSMTHHPSIVPAVRDIGRKVVMSIHTTGGFNPSRGP